MSSPGPHPSWEPRLVELLQSYERPFEETGAEVEITWPDEEGGATAAYALARHYRIEEVDDELTLWMRPIVGGYEHGPAARAAPTTSMRPGATPSRPTPSRSIRRPISAARGAPVDGSSSVPSQRSAGLSSTPGTPSATSTSRTTN